MERTKEEVEAIEARLARLNVSHLFYYMLGCARADVKTPFFEALEDAMTYFESKKSIFGHQTGGDS